jgi:voltage-gated potassium channel
MAPLRSGGPPGTLRNRAYQVIFEHDTRAGKIFDVLLIAAILASVAVVMAESVGSVRLAHGQTLRRLEWIFTVLFTIEYLARLWSVDRAGAYARSFLGLVDLFAVIPTYLSLVAPGGQVLVVIRVLRVVRVFRVLKLAHYVGEARVLAAALRASRYKITVFLISVVSIVVVVGALMYLVEGPEAGFTSIPRGMYWSIVTLTTVGYGDIAPQTPVGQILAALVMIMGYGIIAVPTGIVTVELGRQAGGSAVPLRCLACGHGEADPRSSFCRYCGGSLSAGPF